VHLRTTIYIIKFCLISIDYNLICIFLNSYSYKNITLYIVVISFDTIIFRYKFHCTTFFFKEQLVH